MDKKNIIYIVGEFPSNTETFIWQELQFMAQKKHILLIALKKNNNLSIEEYICSNIKIVYIPFYSLKHWIKFTLNYFYSLRIDSTNTNKIYSSKKNKITLFIKEIKIKFICFHALNEVARYKYEHIHAHFAGFPTTVAMKLSCLLHIPFSFTAHAHDIYAEDDFLKEKIDMASFVVTCTEYNRLFLNTLSPSQNKKIHMIYHGVNLSKWEYNQHHSENKDCLNILTIGRLVEKKGFIYLLKALSILKQKKIIFRCTIVGEGKDFKSLFTYCQQNNLVNEITFTGWLFSNEIKKMMYKADIFVLPSIIAANNDRDGLPNVLLEAMATGTAVISTNVSAIPELIKNYQNGILIPERREDLLADSLIYIFKNKETKKHLIINARKTVEVLFDSNICNNKFEDLFANYSK